MQTARILDEERVSHSHGAASEDGKRPDFVFPSIERYHDASWPADHLRMLATKTTLFFAAFLPQFIDAQANPLVQTLALGCVFVAIAGCTDLIYVAAASLIGPRLGRATRHAVWGNRLAGTSFIGLGVLTAMGSRPTTR